MPSLFIPRKSEIKALETNFAAGYRIGLISGSAGIGKTTLIRLFLQDRFGRDFGHDLFPGGVSYVYGFDPTILQDALVKQISFPPSERALLVIDEAELLSEVKMPILRNLVDNHPNMSILISSRDPSRYSDVIDFSVKLDGLPFEAFAALFRENGGILPEDTSRQLWRLTGGNPMMGNLVAEQVREGLFNWDQMLQAFEGFSRGGILDPSHKAVDIDRDPQSPLVVQVQSINEGLLRMLKTDPTGFHSLSPRQFEETVAELLRRQGYSVELTPASGDGGVDIYVARRESFGEFLYLVECKRYTPPHKVGVEVVRSLYGVVQQQNANGGIVVTISFFTAGAKDFQQTRRYQMHLRDYFELQRWLNML